MIEVTGITKRYGALTALENFSFALESGDIVGFIGPNGAGKSTMMKIITGCLAPSEGTAVIDGFDIAENPVEAKVRIGYLPEQPPLYPAFTVNEYLDTVFDIKQIKANRKERIGEVAELCGLAEVRKRRIGNLSKGYCQRVGLAQAILSYPPYLVLDEPTSGLDPAQKRDMLALVKMLGKKSGIILSSHILSEIDSVCNKILMINHGKRISFTDRDKVGEENQSRTVVIRYTIAGGKAAVLGALSGMPGVVKTEAAEKDGKTACRVTANGDIRERIFEGLSKQGLPILECVTESSKLENVFLSMTDDAAKNKARRGEK